MEFTSGQLLLFFLRGLFVGVLPFAAYFYLKKRHGGRAFPVFIGVVTVMLFIVPRAMLRSIFTPGAEKSLTVRYLTYWLIGAACEELGRYIAMKHAMPNHDTLADALCYGIGHGSTEVMISAGMQFRLLADAIGHCGTPEHLTALSEQGILTLAEILTGNVSNLIFHMAMSVMIARAVHYDNCKKLIPIAVFIHVLANYTEFCFGTLAGTMLTALIVLGVWRFCIAEDDALINEEL